MPSVFASANRSVVSAQTSVRCSASVHVRPVWRSHRINQSSLGCQKVSTRRSPLWFSRGSCTSCTAQRDSQQQPSECITPEIVPEDEHCDLQAHSQPRAVESNTRGPASWLLAGHQKKVSALLGFAGLSAASLIGRLCLHMSVLFVEVHASVGLVVQSTNDCA